MTTSRALLKVHKGLYVGNMSEILPNQSRGKVKASTTWGLKPSSGVLLVCHFDSYLRETDRHPLTSLRRQPWAGETRVGIGIGSSSNLSCHLSSPISEAFSFFKERAKHRVKTHRGETQESEGEKKRRRCREKNLRGVKHEASIPFCRM